jgi:hypothetical protein
VIAQPFFVEVVEAEVLDRVAEARVLRVERIFGSAASISLTNCAAPLHVLGRVSRIRLFDTLPLLQGR